MVSILLGVRNGGGVCCCCLPSAVVWLVPYSSHCSAGEYCCHVAHCSIAGCCGVWVVSVRLWCSCGGVSSVRLPPRRGWWGGIVDGGWHDEGRAAVLLASPSCVWCPPSVCWRPPSVCVVVPLNGGCGVLSCCPRVWIGSSPSHCPTPSCIVLLSLVLSSHPPFVFAVTALLV